MSNIDITFLDSRKLLLSFVNVDTLIFIVTVISIVLFLLGTGLKSLNMFNEKWLL